MIASNDEPVVNRDASLCADADMTPVSWTMYIGVMLMAWCPAPRTGQD